MKKIIAIAAVLLCAARAYADQLTDELNAFLKNKTPTTAESLSQDIVQFAITDSQTGESMLFVIPRQTAWSCMDHLFEKGEAQGLKRMCDAYSATNRNDPFLYFTRGRLCEVEGELDKAIAEYRQSLIVSPKFSLSKYFLSAFYAFDKNDPQESQKYRSDFDKDLGAAGERANVIKKDVVYVITQNGIYLMNKKRDFTAAILQFKKALALDPDAEQAQLNLAIAYLNKGKKMRDLALYGQGMELLKRIGRQAKDQLARKYASEVLNEIAE